MLKSLITEYGISWVIFRLLYSLKLKMLRLIPLSENLFEKDIKVKRVNIFDLNTLEIQKYLKKLSKKDQNNIINIADNSIYGKITGFSSVELDYGNPIKWNYNPITGSSVSSDLKWYQISDFDSARGDIKIIWEASRFTHLFYFVRAYMITQNTKYYTAFSTQIDSWLKDNPYSYGANYKCGQEATLRMINVLIAYNVFKDYGLTTEKDKTNVIKIVEGSYKKIISNFYYAHRCIKNNHTLSEITGLIIGAWCCDDENKLIKAYELLDKEIQKQFLPDGGYIQYSFNYQRFALQIIECIYKINEKTNINISEKNKQLIKNSAMLMYQMQDESGDLANYGSNDGALIFPVTACKYRDFRPVINTIYTLTTNKRLFDNGIYDEELLWFGDKESLDTTKNIIKRKSSQFNLSGYFTFRHQGGFMMICLQDYKTRPAQMDQLHIDLWHKGVNVFCDTGTYSYASKLGKELSATSGHNTVKLTDIEQMNKKGAFLVLDWTMRKNVEHTEQYFTGTMISQNGYEHTRNIKKIDDGYEIRDEVIGDGENCELYYHTPCEVRVVTEGFELYYKEKLICTIEITGDVNVTKAYRSLYYLKKEEINCICISRKIEDRKCSIISKIKLI